MASSLTVNIILKILKDSVPLCQTPAQLLPLNGKYCLLADIHRQRQQSNTSIATRSSQEHIVHVDFITAMAHIGIGLIWNRIMKAKPYTLLTVRMPPDLQNVLETILAEKGETVSTIVSDLVRAVAADVRRADHGISQMMAGGSPVSARDFK